MPQNKTNSRTKERFIGIPYKVVMADVFTKLRAPEVKLLLDLLTQYNGRNNGMLSACLALMKKRNWASASLHRALNKLLHAGFLVVTRQGWKQRGKPTLLAITWLNIDDPTDPEVSYDSGIQSSPFPLGYWYKDKSSWKHQPTVKKIAAPGRSRKKGLVLHNGAASVLHSQIDSNME